MVKRYLLVSLPVVVVVTLLLLRPTEYHDRLADIPESASLIDNDVPQFHQIHKHQIYIIFIFIVLFIINNGGLGISVVLQLDETKGRESFS